MTDIIDTVVTEATQEQAEVAKGETVYLIHDGYARTLPSNLVTAGLVVTQTSIVPSETINPRTKEPYLNETAPLTIEVKPNAMTAALKAYGQEFMSIKDVAKRKAFMESFQFTFKPEDLQFRQEQVLQQSLRVDPRPNAIPKFRNPIIGLDVDAEGNPTDVDMLIMEVDLASTLESDTEYVSGSAYFGS